MIWPINLKRLGIELLRLAATTVCIVSTCLILWSLL
jgi:hypothetical protein